MRRPGPATLEPLPEDTATVTESDVVTPVDAPRVDRSFAAARTAPAASLPSRAESRAARAEQEIAARRSVTDYGYVMGELKRIFITALIVVIGLAIIAIVHH